MSITPRRTSIAALAVAAAVVLVGGRVPARASGQSAAASTTTSLKVKDARLKFEINATDHDGGVQVFIDADSWKRISVFDPAGRRVFTSTTEGRMARQGGTELFLESAEPTFSKLPLAKLLERFPAGTYRIRGVSLDGKPYIGSAQLTHDLPDGPKLISPLEGGRKQDPRRTVLVWKRVPPANGSPIVGYQVLVVQPETGLRALPKVTLDVTMPPTATTLTVPDGFLRPATEYEWEVLAIERGGNQTLSSSTFVTTG